MKVPGEQVNVLDKMRAWNTKRKLAAENKDARGNEEGEDKDFLD